MTRMSTKEPYWKAAVGQERAFAFAVKAQVNGEGSLWIGPAPGLIL